jgi:ABC-type transporter Mla subunit MlaD
MANPIVQQINTELEALKNKLSEFKSTVTYLNNAKENVTGAIETLNGSEKHFDKKVEELKSTYNSFIKLTDTVSEVISKIDTINFPERLDSIEATVQETIKQLNDIKKETLEELQKASEAISKADFEGKFDNLQKEISISVKSNNELSEAIEKQKLGEKIEEFERLISKRIHESYKEVTKNTNEIATNTAKTIHDINLPIRIDKLDANISGILVAVQNIQARLDIVERNIGDRIKDSADKQAVLLSDLSIELAAIAKKQQKNTFIMWAIIVIVLITIVILKYDKF